MALTKTLTNLLRSIIKISKGEIDSTMILMKDGNGNLKAMDSSDLFPIRDTVDDINNAIGYGFFTVANSAKNTPYGSSNNSDFVLSSVHRTTSGSIYGIQIYFSLATAQGLYMRSALGTNFNAWKKLAFDSSYTDPNT